MKLIRNFLLPILAVAAICQVALCDEWGDLKGQFLFDGKIPTANKLSITKDIEVCGKHKLVDESLVVNPKTRGISNVVVYVYLKSKDPRPKVHPSYEKTAKSEVAFNNKFCAFSPRVSLLRTTQTLNIGNLDPVGHNTKMTTPKNGEINPIIPANGNLKKQFTVAERLPCEVACNIHPWMRGYLVVKDNPYMAVTDTDGKFVIKNLPVGEWTFQFWHEKSGYIDEAKTKKDGKVKWKRGRLKVKVDDDGEDLGVIEVPASKFESK